MNIKPGDKIKSKWSGKIFRFASEENGVLCFRQDKVKLGSCAFIQNFKIKRASLKDKLDKGHYIKVGDW